MALAMSTPWKHPRSRVYYLRRRVPDDLKPLLGRTEVRRSLGTSDPREAKRLFAIALAELEAQWANLRTGPRGLTEREAHEAASGLAAAFFAEHRDYPSRQTFWRADIGDALFEKPTLELHGELSASELILTGIDQHMVKRCEMRAWCQQTADGYLAHHGMRVDTESRDYLVRAIAGAIQNAAVSLHNISRGRSVSAVHKFELPVSVAHGHTVMDSRVHDGTDRREASVSFAQLVAGWLRERQPAAKTRYVFPRVVDEFVRFVGHNDAGAVSDSDLVRWKDSLLEQGLRGSTVRNGKIGPVKTILQWGVDNKKLTANVARGIKVTTKARSLDRKRDPSEAEVAIVLAAASEARDSVRRWVPWLCAYTGARVAEVCQLRKEDIFADHGIHVLAFRPEAGSLKNANSERTIPVHPALIKQGFLEFVAASRPGPLFSDLPPDRFGSRGGNGSKLLGRWIRSLGLTDPRMQPNHGWRHRFSTLSRDRGLREDVTIYILGRQKSVSGAYGGYGLPMLYEQMARIP